MVSDIVNRLGVTHLLDYGCGENVTLAKNLKLNAKLTYQAYDPCVERFSAPPLPAELVCCLDVLEHIEPDLLDNVLDDLTRLCEGVMFLSVCTKAALKVLPDGRNAHLIIEPIQWWLPRVWDRWDIQTVQMISDCSYAVIGTAKPRIEDTAGVAIV